MSPLSIVVAIIGLALLIVLHEGGHFLVARLCGMRVERFSIGFGPPLVSFKRGGTIFQIAPIPLGGFVQITGLNPNEEFDKSDPMVYPNRPRWMRLAIVLAGPAANYLTAIVLAFFVLLRLRHRAEDAARSKSRPRTAPRRGRAQGGRRPGRGERPAGRRRAPDQRGHQGRARARRSTSRSCATARQMVFDVTPDQNKGAYQVGIHIGPSGERTQVSLGTAAKEAVVYPYYASVDILAGPLRHDPRQGARRTCSGPIGITKQIAKAANRGAVNFLSMLMMLSVYLGLFNLLPLPALDGGRAVFLGIESVIRRQVDPRIEAAVHTAGFVLLLGVLLVVSFKDIFGKG